MQNSSDKAAIIPIGKEKFRQSVAGNPSSSSLKEKLVKLPTPVLRLREISQKQLKAAIQNLFDHVDDALFELADRATSNLEQNLFFESMRDIRIQRRNMEKTFLLGLDRNFTKLIADEEEDVQPEPVDLDSEELSLVSKSELEELVAIDSLVTKSWSHNKGALRHLSARLNSLVPTAVTEKNSPVSPRCLADSFNEAAKLVSIDIKAKLVLYKLFERYVMNQLGVLLDHMNVALTELGIAAPAKAKPEVSHSNYQASNPNAGYRGSLPEQNQQGPADLSPGTQGEEAGDLFNALQALMQANGRNQGAAPIPQAAPDSSAEKLLKGLSQLQAQQSLQSQESGGNTQPQLLPVAAISSAITNTYGQNLVDDRSENVIKLVDMLFSFILEDRNLPDPIKYLLSRLQIPFIKVALADENFFNKDGHSARRLLNEMATASIGWNAGMARGKKDPLYEKIESIVEKILREFDSNLGIFTILLTDFVAFVEKERRRVMLFEKRALDAEGGKAKAEMGRQAVEVELNTLILEYPLPTIIKQFLRGPWSNILFLIYMRQGEGSPQWEQALSTAERLVWSAQPIEHDQHKSDLMALLPSLRSELQKELEGISFSSAKQAKIFERIKAHHLSLFTAYRAKLTQAEKPQPLVEEPKAFAPEPAVPGMTEDKMEQVLGDVDALLDGADAEAPAPLVQAEQELVQKPPVDASVTEEIAAPVEQHVEPSVPSAEEQVTAPEAGQPPVEAPVEDAQTDQQYLNLVDNLVVGVWFEKQDKGESVYRCRLAAIIRGTGKYIFVNRAGVKVAEETRESLATQLQAGKIRTLDDGMLFDRALESVISSLRKD